MSDLKELVALASEQINLETTVTQLEEDLKSVKERLRKVSESDIPEAMATLGVDSIKLNNGKTIVVEKKYSATISKAKKVAALQWLREHGHGSLIKRKIGAQFGRGEDGDAAELLTELSNRNLYVYDEAGVHHSTLRAFVKEQMEAGENIPEDLFGIYVVNKAKVS